MSEFLSDSELVLVGVISRHRLVSGEELSRALQLHKENPGLASALLRASELEPAALDGACREAGLSLIWCERCGTPPRLIPASAARPPCPGCTRTLSAVDPQPSSRSTSDLPASIGAYQIIDEIGRGAMGRAPAGRSSAPNIRSPCRPFSSRSTR